MMAQAIAPAQRRTPQRFPRQLVEDQTVFALVLWAGFFGTVMLFVLGLSFWREITISGWDVAAQIVLWFGLFIGVHVGWSVMPLYITHGYTRREFMRQALQFLAIYVTVLAVLIAAGFLLEAWVYRLAGWPQIIADERLYDSGLQLHLIFVESWMQCALWTVAGFFIAALWYRNDGLGALAILVAILAAGISGLMFGSAARGPVPIGRLFRRFFGDPYFAEQVVYVVVGAIVHVALIALLLTLSWAAIRSVAIRSKSA